MSAATQADLLALKREILAAIALVAKSARPRPTAECLTIGARAGAKRLRMRHEEFLAALNRGEIADAVKKPHGVNGHRWELKVSAIDAWAKGRK